MGHSAAQTVLTGLTPLLTAQPALTERNTELCCQPQSATARRTEGDFHPDMSLWGECPRQQKQVRERTIDNRGKMRNLTVKVTLYFFAVCENFHYE